MSRPIVLVTAVTLLVCCHVGLSAQQPSVANVRTEIQQVVHAYVDAFNKADAATLVELYSREPGVTSVGDGQITRGWDAIRSAYDSIAGEEGKYKLATGSIDVVPLGAGYALALTSTILTVKSGEQEVQLRGAMTLVLKKTAGEWKIVHDHTSTVTPTSAPTEGAGAAPTAAAAAPRPTQAERTTAAAPAAPASAPVVTVGIADGRAVEIEPGKYLFYTFQLPRGACSITGRIVGISGGNKDFEALIMDDDNFRNWAAGQQARAFWQSGRVVVTNIESTVINGPGTFRLVISNVWSTFTGKTVQPQAAAQCST